MDILPCDGESDIAEVCFGVVCGVGDGDVVACSCADDEELCGDGSLAGAFEVFLEHGEFFASDEPGADGGGAEHGEGARDIDALAGGVGSECSGGLVFADAESVGADGAVDGGVEGDGDDAVHAPVRLVLVLGSLAVASVAADGAWMG